MKVTLMKKLQKVRAVFLTLTAIKLLMLLILIVAVAAAVVVRIAFRNCTFTHCHFVPDKTIK